MKLLQRVLDLLWPRNCEICGRPVDREARYICADCLNRIPFVRPEDGMYEIDDAASAVRFECETREMINGFKFAATYGSRTISSTGWRRRRGRSSTSRR